MICVLSLIVQQIEYTSTVKEDLSLILLLYISANDSLAFLVLYMPIYDFLSSALKFFSSDTYGFYTQHVPLSLFYSWVFYKISIFPVQVLYCYLGH